jgi:hypothetical protein
MLTNSAPLNFAPLCTSSPVSQPKNLDEKSSFCKIYIYFVVVMLNLSPLARERGDKLTNSTFFESFWPIYMPVRPAECSCQEFGKVRKSAEKNATESTEGIFLDDTNF